MSGAEREALQRALTMAAEGDRSALGPLLELAAPLVWRIARRALTGAAEAEDAAQEALIKLMRHAPRFDPARDAGAWIASITINECRHARRARARRREVAFAAAPPERGGVPGPDRGLLEAELELALGRAIATLREVDRRTLLEALGERPREPGLSPAVWRKRWQRVRERLRLAWKEQRDGS